MTGRRDENYITLGIFRPKGLILFYFLWLKQRQIE